MKVNAVAAVLALAPLTALAHAGHGLADGHEWFHALLPFVGALGVLVLRGVAGRVREVMAKARKR